MSPKEVKLTAEQKERLLRNIWLAHDGRWLLKAAEKFGFDVATNLNLAVQESIGKTETKQLLAETNYREIKNVEDLKALIELACHLYTPADNKNEVEIMDNGTIMVYVWDCYVHKMVSKAGNICLHQCSSRIRCESWLKGLGLNGEVINEKNTNNCNGACEIIFKIKW
jgi:hypothetical protein